MQAYSIDLRERVAAAYATGQFTIAQVAKQFTVSISFVDQLRQRLGGRAAQPRRAGPTAGRSGPPASFELPGGSARCHARRVAPAPGRGGRTRRGAHRALADAPAAKLAAQNKRVYAAARDTARVRSLRQAFLEVIEHEEGTRSKFVDETSVKLSCPRRYSCAWAGGRLDQAVPLHHGPNVTVVAALTLQGVQAVMEADGAVTTTHYLQQVLGPTLQPGDVVVLDNLGVHKASRMAELVEARGARLLFLPPYSPDLTPIELAFSKLKTPVHTAAARTREALTARQTGLDAEN